MLLEAPREIFPGSMLRAPAAGPVAFPEGTLPGLAPGAAFGGGILPEAAVPPPDPGPRFPGTVLPPPKGPPPGNSIGRPLIAGLMGGPALGNDGGPAPPASPPIGGPPIGGPPIRRPPMGGPAGIGGGPGGPKANAFETATVSATRP